MMIWHVNTEWAKANQKALIGSAKARHQAVRYMIDPAHRQEVSEILANASKSGLGDALKTWDLCVKINAYISDGTVAPATLDRVTATPLETGDIKSPVKPDGMFYDDQYVRAAAR